MIKKKLLFLLVWMPFFMLAQFTQTLTSTPEFCTGDGKVKIDIANTTAGASFDFVFYRLPNSTTAYRTASGVIASSTSLSHTENNLPSGNYTLTTYENVGGVITTKNSTFTVTNNFVAVNFTNKVTYSCGLANITANVTSGNPATFELRNASTGTLVAGPQTSNVFSGIQAGTYNVIVTDICGNTKSLSATTVAETNNYVFVRAATNNLGFNQLADCTHYNHSIFLRRNGNNSIPAEKFPIQITYEVTGLGGSPITTLNYTMNSPSDNGMIVTDVPFYYNQAFSVKATLTDACGKTYTQTDAIPARTIDIEVTRPAAICGQNYLTIRTYLAAAPYTLEFTNYPAGFQPWNFSSNFSSGSYTGNFTNLPTVDIGNYNNPLPVGSYTLKLTDNCGHTVSKNFTVTAANVLRERYHREGCGINGGSYFQITASNNLQQVGDITALRIISGPSSFSATYPVDMSSGIVSDGGAYVGNLPAGTYVFEADNTCGSPKRATINYTGANINVDSNIVYNCGSFNYTATLSSNVYNPYVYLEHYNSTTSTWDLVSAVPRPGAVSSYSGTINNITQTGDFRIRMVYGSYTMGGTIECTEVIENFTVTPGGLSLNNYYVVSCADNTYNLILDATGIPPLTYEIIEKDGVSFSINNGSNPVFTNLSQGTYKVKISDTCNSIIVNLRVVANKFPKIKTSNLCNGQNGKLYIDGLSFLTIHWLKDGVDTGVTGNTYNFTPYNSATDTGLYEAVLTYEPNTNYCISNTLAFNLTTSNENNASAGTGGTFTIFATDVTGELDLFSYLTGTYDTYGKWTETTGSGLLIDNNWYAQFANGGTYTFEYTVNGTCSGTDTSTVTLIFKKECYKDAVTDGNIYPSKHGITALGRAGETQDNWPMVRQSAYTVLEANTKGFVVNRLNTAQIQAITDAGNAVDGMMVYDTDADCLKIYVHDTVVPANSGWKCFKTPACPQD